MPPRVLLVAAAVVAVLAVAAVARRSPRPRAASITFLRAAAVAEAHRGAIEASRWRVRIAGDLRLRRPPADAVADAAAVALDRYVERILGSRTSGLPRYASGPNGPWPDWCLP